MKKFIPLMSLLMACSYFFGASMFAGSLPQIQADLATTQSHIQQTISWFLIAVGLSQLVFGVWSERLGRRPVFLLSAVLFVIGSFICSQGGSITMLLTGRVVQGIGCGGLFLLTRTILQDSFEKKEMMRILAWFSLFFVTLPGTAPALGGGLSQLWGWQSNFYFLFALSIFILAALCFMPETIAEKKPQATLAHNWLKTYSKIAFHPSFICYSLMLTGGLATMLLLQMTGTYVLSSVFHLSPSAIGGYTASIVCCSVVARFIFDVWLKDRFTEKVVLKASCCLLIFGAVVLLCNLYQAHLAMVILGFSIMSFANGTIAMIAGVSALYLFPEEKGQVGAIYGAWQILGCFVATLVFSYVATDVSTLVLAASLVSLMICCAVACQLRLAQPAKLTESGKEETC